MLCHTKEYIERIKKMSSIPDSIHVVGVDCTMSSGGHEIATLSAGGGLVAVDAVMNGTVTNAYALIRPPVRQCDSFFVL